tara:strand:- start:532 stop:1098 length:567 start_codon:yes stop_codon:yes gene_type:complete
MEKITIDFAVLSKEGLSINEYLTLYNLVCPECINNMFRHEDRDLMSIQDKGFIKITSKEIFIREKAKEMFMVKEDLFLKWLLAYPIRVMKSHGGSRVLSPKTDDTIAGKELRKKWNKIFKGNPAGELKAIEVLKAEVAMRIKANDLEFMVEANRWLNGGYHEKYEYLLDEKTDVNAQGIVDGYEEDWD